jgi:hypothetical protein
MENHSLTLANHKFLLTGRTPYGPAAEVQTDDRAIADRIIASWTTSGFKNVKMVEQIQMTGSKD